MTIFLGAQNLMLEFNRELFDLGIKCSSVGYPAVAKGGSILRLVLASKHSEADLAFALERLVQLGKKYGILHRSAQEICELGERFTAGARASLPPMAAPDLGVAI